MADKKNQYRVNVEPSVAKDADAVFSRRKIPRGAAVTRILQWFVDAPPSVQQDMLGQLPEDNRANIMLLIAKSALEAETESEAQRRQLMQEIAAALGVEVGSLPAPSSPPKKKRRG